MIQDEIPEWQTDESMSSVQKMKKDPASGMDSDSFLLWFPDDSE